MAGLMDIPGLGGYVASQQMRQQRDAGDLQQATQIQTLAQMLQKQQADAALKTALSESGGDVDKALAIAIKSGNMAAAHQLAPLVEIQRKKEETQALAGVDMNDPEQLRKVGIKLKKPEFITHAERIDKQREDAAALKAMQSGAQTIQPDPQEISQAADQGTPTPVPGQVQRGGIFDDLAKSEIPHIANAAKNMQAQLDRAGSTIPSAYWQKQHEGLSAREAGYLQAKSLADVKRTAAEAGSLAEDDVKFMAGQYLAGDRSVMQNLGRGAQGAENIVKLRKEIAKQARESGAGPRDVAAAIGEFEGFKSGQRALGTREAQIEMAANVTKQFAPLAIDASEKFDRTQFKTLNDVEKAVLSRSASPELRRFNFANTSLINAYARAVNPSGVPTVSDKDHAREILDTGFSKGDYAAAVDQLNKEIDAELKAPGAVKRGMRNFLTKGAGGEAPAPTAPAATQRIRFNANGEIIQ